MFPGFDEPMVLRSGRPSPHLPRARGVQCAGGMSTRSLLGLTVSLVGLVGLAACGDSKVPGEPFGVGSEAVTTQYGVDYSFARPSPASITAAGYTFVVRYSSNDPGKN